MAAAFGIRRASAQSDGGAVCDVAKRRARCRSDARGRLRPTDEEAPLAVTHWHEHTELCGDRHIAGPQKTKLVINIKFTGFARHLSATNQ